MCRRLINLIPFVLVLGLAAGIASGDVLVLLDFEGTDTWTDNWDDVQVTETSDAPEGSTTASTWEIPGNDGGELVRHWVPPLDLSAYSHFNFYMKVTADPGAGSGTWLGVEGDAGGSGIWIEPLSDVPGFTVGEWFYVSIPFTTLLEDTWDTFPEDYSEVSTLVFWFESWSGTGFHVSIDYVTVSDTPEEGILVAEPDQTEIILTFADLDQGGEVAVAEDYQPPELEGTGITTTWTGWQQFNDDIAGEGLRDHTEIWDPGVTSVYVYTYEAGGSIVFNSEVEVPSIWILQDSWASTSVAGHLGGQEIWSVPADHPEQWVEITEGAGHVIDSIVVVGGYSRIDDVTMRVGMSYNATDPSPADDADDVPRDVVLSWESGKYAATHNVYFGTSASAVGGATVTNPRDVLLIEGHDSDSYDPEMILDLGQTYFWRVDEVNAAPDNTVYRGKVWSFTAEPVGYPIADVTATASSSTAGQGAENTVNNSGMDANDLHSRESASMWLSEDVGEQQTWIEYQFDKIYKLHQMLVWNYNVELEEVVGFGFNDVKIEYLMEDSNWTQLEGVHQFERAPGTNGYAHNTTIDFDGVLAKSVRLTANSNHGPYNKYGLSEVRFLYIPGWARKPDPQDGATGIHPDAILSWRPGREAATHDVYLSSDEQDVISGTVPAAPVTDASYDAGMLELSKTYHWRVDEVNAAEIPPIWEGDIWSFTTADYIVVDNFESYNGLDPDDPQSNRIFMMWKDGVGYGTQDNPPYFVGNGTGSIIGHADPPFVELEIVHDGKQSMPYFYDNSGLTGKANYSEAEVDISELGIGPDWTAHSLKTLSLYFRGTPGNTGQLYVKINGNEVPYDLDPADIARPAWQAWNIDLSTVGGGLQNVTSLTIGVKGSGAAGTLYIEDIRLYPLIGELITPVEPTTGLVAHYDLEGDTQDDSGSGNHGVRVGDARFADDPDRGTVLNLNGVDAIVEVAHAASIGFGDTTNLTLAVWLKPAQIPSSSWRGVVTKNRAVDAGDGYGIWISASNGWHFRVGPTSGDANLSGAPDVTEEWHSVVMTHDADTTTLRGYVDGWMVYENTDSDPTPFTVQDALWIGGAEGVAEYYPGIIDEVSLFNRALSDAEVLWLAGVTQPVHKPF